MENTLRLTSLFLLFLIPLCAGTYNGGDGSEENPYKIASTTDLIELSNTSDDWSSHFIQMANISFKADSSLVDWNGDGTVWDEDDEKGFIPIGNLTIQFSGTYNGQGYIINHLFIKRSSIYSGLFGYIYNANITNLGLTDVNISGNNYTGALLGYCHGQYTRINSCYSTGKVSGVYYVGGLGGTIKGYNNSNYMLITNCFSTCDVEGEYQTGGFAGQLDDIYVENCYSTGNVSGGNYSAGFAGYTHRADLTNCYARGDIYAPEGNNIAGLTGKLWVSNLENCYSTGIVTASESANYIGGLNAQTLIGNIINCFWDRETSSQTTSADGGAGETTKNMTTQSTFTNAGWDFVGELDNGNEEIWAIDPSINDGYPYLANLPDAEIATPIRLVSFDAIAKNGKVRLTWSTASETNNARFVIYRNDEPIASIEGAGTTSETHNYSFTDNSLIPGVNYSYVLADINYANELIKHENMAVSVTVANAVKEADFCIGSAYPNPFNPIAVLPIKLNKDARVKASVYDLNGQKVSELVNGHFTAGTHEVKIDGATMSTGIYMVNILVNDIMKVQKIALVK